MFLDVGFYRNKVLTNKLRGLVVFIRLGIQPSTSASSRCCAKVQQNAPSFLVGLS